MTIAELKKIADLSYLDPVDAEALLDEANLILNKMDTLHQLDVANVEPLLHPVSTHQTVRTDDISADNHVDALAKIAPLFVDGYYLVPRVIQGK